MPPPALQLMKVLGELEAEPSAGERGSERTECNLCGGRDLRTLFKIDSRRFYNLVHCLRDQYTIVRCGDCELVFVKEIPSTEELKDVYSEGYYAGRDAVGYRSYRARSRAERIAQWLSSAPGRMLRLLKTPSRIPAKAMDFMNRRSPRPWPYDLVDTVQRYAKGGKILDVGCATGLFLSAARESGWDTMGVELSDYSSEKARREHGLSVFTGTLQSALQSGALMEDSFDAVTLWDTAEHVVEPAAVFGDAWKVLKPEGLLFVKTLNIDGDRAKEEGDNWHFFRPPKHLFYYSEHTLKRYFARNGFELVADGNFANDVVTLVGKKRQLSSKKRRPDSPDCSGMTAG